MFLERLVHGVEQRMAAIGRRLWQTDPLTQLREDVAFVCDDLARRRKALEKCRAELEAARSRINENQATVALLTGRIGMALARGGADQAWREALDLDKARRQLTEDQVKLPKQEQVCATLELQIRFMTRRLARLQGQLYEQCK
jgi:hypothetical protein